MQTVKRKHIDISITEINGSWTVETPLYVMEGIKIGDMTTVVAPLGGLRANFQVTAPSTATAELFMSTARQMSGWSQYLDPSSPSLTNYLYNLALMADDKEISSLRPLKGALRGKPMILVGAGPSLDKHLSEIRRITENNTAFVVAGGSAIRAMCEANINPHLCVAFDSNENEWDQVFNKLGYEWASKQSLVTYPYLELGCFDWWPGQMYVAGGSSAFTGNNIYDSLHTIDVGGSSVSTMIANLASYMGAESLHLVGVDLCWASDGDSYIIDAEIDTSGAIIHNGIKTTYHWLKEADNIAALAANSKYKAYHSRGPSCTQIAGLCTRSLDMYIKPHNMHMTFAPCTQDQKNQWAENLNDIAEEIYGGQMYGLDSPEFKATKTYKQIIAPYDFFLRAREIWTRHYDKHIIEAVCENIVRTIDHEGK